MNSMILLESIGAIDDTYILSAQNQLDPISNASIKAAYIAKRKHPTRKTVLCIAAVITMLLASFTVAMAASEEFREFVFSIFHISTTESLPDNTNVPVPDGDMEQIGGTTIDEAVTTYYFKGNGILIPAGGLLYSGSYDGTVCSFYDLDSNGLVPLTTTRIEFPYSFRGTDFTIKFDYTVCREELCFSIDPENLDDDPYRYGWDMRRAGTTADKAWLILPYPTSGDYGMYPLLLDIGTSQVSDVLAGLPLDGIIPIRWEFSDDGTFALLSGYLPEYKPGFWLCDMGEKTLTPLSELTGRAIIDSYLLNGESVICYAENSGGFDVIRYEPETGTMATVVENTVHYGLSGDGSGFRSIEYYGGQGRHALLLDGAGGVTLVDLRDGRRTPLEGIPGGSSLLTSESPDGTHILFAFKDKSVTVPNTKAMVQLGMLDTQTGVLTMLDRENYQVRSETILGWLANGCVAVLAFDENEEHGWYLYVYDFR